MRIAGTWIGQDRQHRNDHPCVARGTANADNPASAPAKLGAEKFSSKGERKCSVVQRDGLIAGTGSARFTAGARKIVFRCPEQLEVRQDQLTL